MVSSYNNDKNSNRKVWMTSKVIEAIEDYILYERTPRRENEQALFLNKYGNRIGEHFIRFNLKKCDIEAGINQRIYPHMLWSCSITHMCNNIKNKKTIQKQAGHKDLRTTMLYNRSDDEEARKEINRTFVNKTDLTIEDRKKAIFDIYLKGEITNKELSHYLESIQPKQLYHKSEFTGYA